MCLLRIIVAEHRTTDQEVEGSNPSGRAKSFNMLTEYTLTKYAV